MTDPLTGRAYQQPRFAESDVRHSRRVTLRWSAPRPVTQHGSLPGCPLQAAGSPRPAIFHGSGPGSERPPRTANTHRQLPGRASAACYLGVVIDPRFGDVPPRAGIKSPLGHQNGDFSPNQTLALRAPRARHAANSSHFGMCTCPERNGRRAKAPVRGDFGPFRPHCGKRNV